MKAYRSGGARAVRRLGFGPRFRGRRPTVRLSSVELYWLTHRKTLKEQIGLSLESRCYKFWQMFSRPLPVYALRQVYKGVGISK